MVINTREIAVEYRLSHWAEIIKERNASGLSIKAYCESIGLHQNVYHYWQRKLREAACTELLPSTVTVKEIAKVPTGWALCESNRQTESTLSNEVTIEIGKSRVTANNGVDLELLSSVCRMLMSLC
jgi:hypothetical protein